MNDPSKYVQKSVANHINDITKEDKELVFQWLQQLRDKQHPVNPWIIKHGLRTVIKMVLYQKIFVLSILNKNAYASKIKHTHFFLLNTAITNVFFQHSISSMKGL